MFTKEELKEMLSGLNLKIEKTQKIYSEKIEAAESCGWEISKAYQNSIDFVDSKIKRLVQLRDKIYKEIKMVEEK